MNTETVDYMNGFSDGFYNNRQTPPDPSTCPMSYNEYMLGYSNGKTEARRVYEANKIKPTGGSHGGKI